MIIQYSPLLRGHHTEPKLNKIYTSILQNAVPVDVIEDEIEFFCNLLMLVLSAVAILLLWLSIPSLALLLDNHENKLFNSQHNLHSIIDIFEDLLKPIRL